MRPACIECGLQMECKKNGYYVLLCADPERNDPYQVWVADLWECPACGLQVTAGYGQAPVAEQFQSDFAAKVENMKPRKVY